MKKQRLVVALGRNAFGETFPEQQKKVKKAADAIADLAELKYDIVITHSNGPQVGRVLQTGTPLHGGADVPVRGYEPGLYWIRSSKCHPYRTA